MKTFLQAHKVISYRMEHAENAENADQYLALHELRKELESREITRRQGIIETFKPHFQWKSSY